MSLSPLTLELYQALLDIGVNPGRSNKLEMAATIEDVVTTHQERACLVLTMGTGCPVAQDPAAKQVERLREIVVQCAMPLEALHLDNLMGSQLIAPTLRVLIAKAIAAARTV